MSADNLAIWEALGKTDPAHTKSFSRAGGFKGTAIKPIWMVKRLTEQFGPCGKGWGIDEPRFQVVPCGDEAMVYCTVRCWYDDGDELSMRPLFGVGGDKVATKRNDGKVFYDDEAFKKAFTDAVGNAFKFVGVGADVHMGQFDDSKYVEAVKREFAAAANDEPKANDDPDREPEAREVLEGPHTSKTALRKAVHVIIGRVRAAETALDIDAILKEEKPTISEANRYWPALINGVSTIPEDTGLRGVVAECRARLSEPEDGQFKMLVESMKTCDNAATLDRWRIANDPIIGELDGAESRKFQLAYELHESALKQVAALNAG